MMNKNKRLTVRNRKQKDVMKELLLNSNVTLIQNHDHRKIVF